MPMFSNIANAIKPPEVEDLSVVQARQAQLRSMAQQAQLGGVQLENALRDQNDDKILRGALKDAGGDIEKAIPLIGQRGGSPAAIQKLRAAQLDIASKKAVAYKDTAQGDSAKKVVEEKTNSMIGDALNAVSNAAPGDERQAAWTTAVTALKTAGNWHPEDTDQYPGDAAFHQMRDKYLGASRVLARQKEDRDAAAALVTTENAKAEELRKSAKAPAELAKATADATTAGVTAGQMQTDGMTLQQRETIDRQTAANLATDANAKARTRIEQARFSLDKKKFDATFGAGLDATGKPLSKEELKVVAENDPIAVGIANYTKLPPRSITDRNGAGQAMLRKVLAINPKWDETKVQPRMKTESDFAPGGKIGQQLTFTDTALAHLDTLSKAGAALKSGNLQILNQIANGLGLQTGASAPAVYDAINAMVAPEVTKAVVGSAGGVGERQEMGGHFGRNQSDAQREGSIGAAIGLLGARYHKQAQAYESQMEKPLARKLSPESQAVLDRYAPKGGQDGGQLPKGGGKQIDKATGQQFYKAAGGDPKKAQKMAEDAGWKVQ